MATGAPMHSRVEADVEAGSDLWACLRQVSGIALDWYRPNVLRRRLETWMARQGLRGSAELLEFLTAYPGKVSELIAYLTVDFSEFFRQRGVFEYLRAHVFQTWLPGRPFRALSLGCSRGQEAYSLAIVCHQVWQWTVDWYVIGVDIDGLNLRQALRGVYGARELRHVTDDERVDFFEPTASSGERYRIRPIVTQRVRFIQGDVFRLPVASEVADLVLLRHLLIFIQPRYHDKILAEVHRVLRPGGRLVLGSVERIPPVGEAAWVPEAPPWRVFRKGAA
ncbi:MAG: methyltransferase domain-containing protein [Acidobacteria bacterium]|nr:methyltransferase domain-containing protein [Acidobacteriota bacterium]MDW7983656.1 CheR family methyltransferase [Acidobacteriota bacterium]